MADLLTRPEPPAPRDPCRLGAARGTPARDLVPAAPAIERRGSASRSTVGSSRASRARPSSRSAATTGSRSRPSATSPSCRASAPAGCAWSRSRARSIRRSPARASCEPEMKVQTQTEEVRRLRRTNLELIFSDHNAYCLPPCQNKCPSHIDIPGFLKANAEGNWTREHPDLQADHPVPVGAGPRVPRAVRGPLPARRGRRGDRDPRHASLCRRPGAQGDARRRRRPAGPVRAAGALGPPGRGHRVGSGRHGRRVLPAHRRPRRHGVRARPGARRHAPLRDPAVPAAQGRGPRGRVRVGHPPRRQDGLQRGPRVATSRSTT